MADTKIEEMLCIGDTIEEVAAKLQVSESEVQSVWDRMMKEMQDWINNPPPRMTDAEMDEFIAEMHGEL